MIEIDGKKVGSFKIGIYDFQMINNQPKIVISQVTALDENGKYIKHCKLENVMPYLSKFYTEFRKAGENE